MLIPRIIHHAIDPAALTAGREIALILLAAAAIHAALGVVAALIDRHRSRP